MGLGHLKKIIILGFLALTLTSCSSNSSVSDSLPYSPPQDSTANETIVAGVTECNNVDEVSPDGKYICVGRGAFYWVLRSEFSESNEQDLDSVTANDSNITTFTLPSFIGSTQSNVDAWKRQNAFQIQILYSTAIGYNYIVSCRTQGNGVVLSQNPPPGSEVVDSFDTIVRLELNC